MRHAGVSTRLLLAFIIALVGVAGQAAAQNPFDIEGTVTPPINSGETAAPANAPPASRAPADPPKPA